MSVCAQCLGLRVTSTGKGCNRCKAGLAVRVALEAATSDDQRRLQLLQVIDAGREILDQRLRYLDACGTSADVRPFGQVMPVEEREALSSTWSKRRADLINAREALLAEPGDS